MQPRGKYGRIIYSLRGNAKRQHKRNRAHHDRESIEELHWHGMHLLLYATLTVSHFGQVRLDARRSWDGGRSRLRASCGVNELPDVPPSHLATGYRHVLSVPVVRPDFVLCDV